MLDYYTGTSMKNDTLCYKINLILFLSLRVESFGFHGIIVDGHDVEVKKIGSDSDKYCFTLSPDFSRLWPRPSTRQPTPRASQHASSQRLTRSVKNIHMYNKIMTIISYTTVDRFKTVNSYLLKADKTLAQAHHLLIFIVL